METPDYARGMPFEEAVALAREIRAVQWYRVTNIQDTAFYPDNWRLGVRYQPRKPNGTSDGVAVGKYVRSRAEWEAFQVMAVELNKRNARSAATRAARKRKQEKEQQP